MLLKRTAVWTKLKDSTGHEHDALGRFGSGGGSSAKPAATAVSSFRAAAKNPEIGDRHEKLDAAVADLKKTPEGKAAVEKGEGIAAKVKSHVEDAVKKGLAALDEESRGGLSLVVGGLRGRSPAAVAHGVAQLTQVIYENVHQEIYETAMADAAFPGAHAAGKLAGKVAAAGEQAVLKGAAWALGKIGLGQGRKSVGGFDFTEEHAALAAKVALDALRKAYAEAGVKAELPSEDEMAKRMAARLGVGPAKKSAPRSVLPK